MVCWQSANRRRQQHIRSALRSDVNLTYVGVVMWRCDVKFRASFEVKDLHESFGSLKRWSDNKNNDNRISDNRNKCMLNNER